MLAWKQRLAWPLHRLREMVMAYPYTRIQRYEIVYRLVLVVKESSPVTLAIPLPRCTSGQLIQRLTIQLPEAHTQTDTAYGNHFLTTTFHAPKGQVEIPIFQSEVEIPPTSPQTATAPQQRGDSLFQDTIHPFLHPHDPRIQSLAKHIGQGSCARETAKRINAYIIDHLVYGDPIDALYSDIDALTNPRVDCGGFDMLFVSLCLANNIPARLVSGFWLDSEKNDMHAWAEFQDEEGRWIPVDPSVEQLARQGRTRKSGRFGYIGSDRLTLSVGCHIPLQINKKLFHAPILQHPFVVEGTRGMTCRGKIQLTRKN